MLNNAKTGRQVGEGGGVIKARKKEGAKGGGKVVYRLEEFIAKSEGAEGAGKRGKRVVEFSPKSEMCERFWK
jgi:hypothetical protein